MNTDTADTTDIGTCTGKTRPTAVNSSSDSQTPPTGGGAGVLTAEAEEFRDISFGTHQKDTMGFSSSSSLVLYDIRAPIIGPFRT